MNSSSFEIELRIISSENLTLYHNFVEDISLLISFTNSIKFLTRSEILRISPS